MTGIVKGSARTGHESAGTVTTDQLRWVAEQKLPDLSATTVEAAMRVVAGTARSMGLGSRTDR